VIPGTPTRATRTGTYRFCDRQWPIGQDILRILNSHNKIILPALAALLDCLLLGLPPAAAQVPQAKPAVPAGTLRIFVLEGQGAVNSIPRHTATMPVVEVRDENDKPVEGAEVVFELPATGPGGFFPGQQRTKRSETNLQGQAAAAFAPNTIAGRFTIRVTATAGNRTGHAAITQTNSLAAEQPEVKRKFGRWKILAVAAAGAAVLGIVLATRGSNGAASTPTITLTPGPPSFGGPP
jgi:hypothetical protein